MVRSAESLRFADRCLKLSAEFDGFAAVVVIVLVAAIAVIVKAIRGGGLPLSEDDPVPSKMFAPSGMIATAGERKVQRQWRVLALMHLDG